MGDFLYRPIYAIVSIPIIALVLYFISIVSINDKFFPFLDGVVVRIGKAFICCMSC